MELREFVRETLKEILLGVSEAQADLHSQQGRRGVINPAWNDTSDLSEHVQDVKFDVAVTVSDQSSKGGKGGIKVWAAELGGELKAQYENTTVSRISFSIPVLPSVITLTEVNKPPKIFQTSEDRITQPHNIID